MVISGKPQKAVGLSAPNGSTGEGLIVKTPGCCGGNARLKGRRVPVWLLADWRKQGHSIPEILEFLPDLSHEEVAAAWEYYDRNLCEIEADIRRNDEI